MVVFICHSWSLLGFFNRLSSFIFYLGLAEIAGVFAFMMAFAFLESLLITALLVLLSAILPTRWLREGFAFKGFIVIVMATASAILLQRTMQGTLPALPVLTLIWFAPVVWAAVFLILAHRMPRVQGLLLEVAERISIMLFVYAPIGILSLIVVTFETLL